MRRRSHTKQTFITLFQSTHPLRDATYDMSRHYSTFKFQSTHPLRDATCLSLLHSSMILYFNPRTPYGMRLSWIRRLSRQKHFNPRTPYGMRLTHRYDLPNTFLFQSTHPLRDATVSEIVSAGCSEISIHAPLTGCDVRSGVRSSRPQYFNPRTPYGMRRYPVLLIT